MDLPSEGSMANKGGVDLPEIQHVPLHHTPTTHALVLHHAEIAMEFAVLLASRGAQEHDG
jgi:hypothetical protein